jgi:hypothetical protein
MDILQLVNVPKVKATLMEARLHCISRFCVSVRTTEDVQSCFDDTTVTLFRRPWLLRVMIRFCSVVPFLLAKLVSDRVLCSFYVSIIIVIV